MKQRESLLKLRDCGCFSAVLFLLLLIVFELKILRLAAYRLGFSPQAEKKVKTKRFYLMAKVGVDTAENELENEKFGRQNYRESDSRRSLRRL